MELTMEEPQVETLGKSVEEEKINIQIFKIEELNKCMEYIKQNCMSPIIKKSKDFDSIDKILICYRTIQASFTTLEILQNVTLKK